MKLWVDDLREPPEGWYWAKTSAHAIEMLILGRSDITVMSLDHDLGGDDTTRPVVMWMCENEQWPKVIQIHTANPVGREWLEGMISRYKPKVNDSCINCDVELELVFPEFAKEGSRQYDNALEICLGGGYSMFFDNIDGDYRVFLCHDCAHQACEALPWLDRLIRPLNSHAHTQQFWDANPDHEGWDKKHAG